jgi:hypothetical protein
VARSIRAVRQPPEAFPADHVAIPTAGGSPRHWARAEHWWDPIQNTLKGDRPLCRRPRRSRPAAAPPASPARHAAILSFASPLVLRRRAISDTVIEPRSFPIPGGVQTTNPDNNDVFGRDNDVYAQTFIFSAALIRVRPPSAGRIEYRATVAVRICRRATARARCPPNPGPNRFG